MPANKRPITAEDLYKFQVLSSPRIDPGGKSIVLSVQRVEKKTEKKYSNLWMVSTEPGGRPQQ